MYFNEFFVWKDQLFELNFCFKVFSLRHPLVLLVYVLPLIITNLMTMQIYEVGTTPLVLVSKISRRL